MHFGYIAHTKNMTFPKTTVNADKRYQQIADEIDKGQQDRAIWAWALAESGGDADKTKALYIRRRFAQLTANSPTATVDSEIQRLRIELRRQLAAQRKQSLYSVIGVPADSSDAAISEAIARISTEKTSIDAETRYAMDELGNPQAREEFDRRLLEQLKSRRAVSTSTSPQEGMPVTSGTSQSVALKAVAGVALVLGIGYLALGFTKEKASHEIRIKEVELQKDVVERSAEIANRVVENQTTVIEASTAARERSAEAREQAREQAQLEAQMREDKRRLDRAYQKEEQADRAEKRRQQSEQRRAESENRKKAYEAARQTRAIRQQAIRDAIARGNHNEAERLRNQQY